MDKIICVGKNYLEHAKELGDAIPDEPLYFLKPPSTFLEVVEKTVEIPRGFEVHHELELVLRLGETDDHGWEFTHYTFGLDLTLRDVQSRLKKAGQPWEKAKVFKNSAIRGPWEPVLTLEETLKIPFALKVNGEVRQRGLGQGMRWKPDELLKDLQKWFPLCDNDVLYTGTPEGVGPLKDGDVVEVNGGAVFYGFECREAHA